jgi:hypothetical protein
MLGKERLLSFFSRRTLFTPGSILKWLCFMLEHSSSLQGRQKEVSQSQTVALKGEMTMHWAGPWCPLWEALCKNLCSSFICPKMQSQPFLYKSFHLSPRVRKEALRMLSFFCGALQSLCSKCLLRESLLSNCQQWWFASDFNTISIFLRMVLLDEHGPLYTTQLPETRTPA